MARFNASYGPLTMIAIFLVLLDIGAFFVLLGGASALQNKAQTIAPLINSMSQQLTYGDLFPYTLPRNFISYEWFKAVFQVLTLLFCLAGLAMGQLYRTRLVMIGLLAVLASLWCDSCNTFYYIRGQVDAAEAVTGTYIAMATRAYWAGCLCSATLNFLLIITLGLSADTSVPDREPVGYAPSASKGNPTYNENTGSNVNAV